MLKMKIIDFVILLLLINFFASCNGQTKIIDPDDSMNNVNVGGAFENSEFIYHNIPQIISSTDTSAGWKQEADKLLIKGIVYQNDVSTPAPNVLLYYYHTNIDGQYIHIGDESRSMAPNKFGHTHGYLRGWINTDSLGRYFIYTVRPGVYPTRDTPAHIHMTVKEPNENNEYYIDDIVFDDDELVNSQYRSKMENRGGSGLVRLVSDSNLLIGERNIILGLNIPNYPD